MNGDAVKRATIFVLLMAMAMTAAACGGGDKAPTMADYTSKATAICKADQAKFSKDSPNISSESALTKYYTTTVIPDFKSEISAIEKLGYPAGDKAGIQKFFAEMTSDLVKISADPGKYLGSGSPFANVSKVAGAYGLKACFDS